MKTKERILQMSLEMFNREGLKNVTLRQIAGALEISQGNLNYHFKTKSDIVSKLYYRLVDELDAEMSSIARKGSVMTLIFKSSYTSMQILFRYRFILKDLYDVLKADSALREHYIQLQGHRKRQFLDLFESLISGGLMRKSEFENEYERLYERMNILGDNWIHASELFHEKNNKSLDYYHDLLFETMYPYLTEKGKVEYRSTGKK